MNKHKEILPRIGQYIYAVYYFRGSCSIVKERVIAKAPQLFVSQNSHENLILHFSGEYYNTLKEAKANNKEYIDKNSYWKHYDDNVWEPMYYSRIIRG